MTKQRPALIVFIHINKTAGTTVRYILRSSYGSRHCDVEPWHGAWSEPAFSLEDLRRVRRIYPALRSIAGHRVTGYVDLHEPGHSVEYVTFLREPLAMCASRFQYQLDYRKKKHLVFEQWIEREWVRNAQTKRIAGCESAAEAASKMEEKEMFVGLTEHFDESLVLLKALRAPDLDISYAPVNVGKRSGVATRLLEDGRTRGMLLEANREDLELYDYVKNHVYPALRAEYGGGLDAAVSQYCNGRSPRFDRWNLARYAVKHRLVHRPLLGLYRARPTGKMVERLVG